jgi:hypothetical protein
MNCAIAATPEALPRRRVTNLYALNEKAYALATSGNITINIIGRSICCSFFKYYSLLMASDFSIKPEGWKNW